MLGVYTAAAVYRRKLVYDVYANCCVCAKLFPDSAFLTHSRLVLINYTSNMAATRSSVTSRRRRLVHLAEQHLTAAQQQRCQAACTAWQPTKSYSVHEKRSGSSVASYSKQCRRMHRPNAHLQVSHHRLYRKYKPNGNYSTHSTTYRVVHNNGLAARS